MNKVNKYVNTYYPVVERQRDHAIDDNDTYVPIQEEDDMKKKVCPNCNKRELIYDDEKGYICLYCEEKRNEMEGLREEREIDTSIIYDPLIEDFTIRRIRTSNR